ncbi:MAG: hypothetical protein NVS1B4_08670 [Gemmatimonadaceae bacterium]
MKLAIFHPTFGAVGGAEILAAGQARALRSSGVDARIVTATVDRDLWNSALDGVPVDCYAQRRPWDLLAWRTVQKLWLRSRRAQKHLRDMDFVVAHNHPCNVMLGAMRLDGIRLWQVNEPPRSLHLTETNPVLTARARVLGSTAPDFLTREFVVRLARWQKRVARGGDVGARCAFDIGMSGRLDGLYAISSYSRSMARRIYGRCSDTVVYPMVRDMPMGPRRRGGVRREAFHVLLQSRLETLKNVDTVLSGFAMFARRHAGAHLHVVGDGLDLERLRALAAEVAPGLVTFHGFLDADALDVVAGACDAFALLPVDEPFGMVFTEAAARGLLCIGPDHGGPREILDDGAHGWLVDAFEADRVAEALEELIGLPDAEATRRRLAAAQSVGQRFSSEAMLTSLRAVRREFGSAE